MLLPLAEESEISVQTEAIPFNSCGSVFFKWRHHFSLPAILHGSGFEDGLKHFMSLKNVACVYLVPSPEPGIVLGPYNQGKPSSGKFEGV